MLKNERSEWMRKTPLDDIVVELSLLLSIVHKLLIYVKSVIHQFSLNDTIIFKTNHTFNTAYNNYSQPNSTYIFIVLY